MQQQEQQQQTSEQCGHPLIGAELMRALQEPIQVRTHDEFVEEVVMGAHSVYAKKYGANHGKQKPGFWMVWRLGHGVLTRKHETPDAALDEAHRLSKQSPGTEFVVLQSVASLVTELAAPEYNVYL